jgi:hypothetical protein
MRMECGERVRRVVVVALALVWMGEPVQARAEDGFVIHGPSGRVSSRLAMSGPFGSRGQQQAEQEQSAATEWLDLGYARKTEGDAKGAAEAFERARALGADGQVVELELGYLDATHGAPESARLHFARAAEGDDAGRAAHARAEMVALAPPANAPVTAPANDSPRAGGTHATDLLALAYRAKSEHRLADAQVAFEGARVAGANPQLVSIELGYLAAARGDFDDARGHFAEAQQGPDRGVAEQAGRELGVSPRHWWGDFYADALGAESTSGQASGPALLVPTARVRAYYRPSLGLDLNFYAYAQATRDTASAAAGPAGVPAIYADDYAMLGVGARFRLWEGRVGLFAQAGPAWNLVRPGATELDARAGFDLYAELPQCAPAPEKELRVQLTPCAEVYVEGVYASRFDNNVIGLARPRGGLTYMVTGPVAWQVVAEGRAGKDLNNDYYNNFVDAGAGPRWRLLAPFRLDLLVTADAGTYLGLHGRDPAPDRLAYTALRLEASTYLEY